MWHTHPDAEVLTDSPMLRYTHTKSQYYSLHFGMSLASHSKASEMRQEATDLFPVMMAQRSMRQRWGDEEIRLPHNNCITFPTNTRAVKISSNIYIYFFIHPAPCVYSRRKECAYRWLHLVTHHVPPRSWDPTWERRSGGEVEERACWPMKEIIRLERILGIHDSFMSILWINEQLQLMRSLLLPR